MTLQQHPKLTIKQDGKEYDLYNLPKRFIIKGDLILYGWHLTELPDLSDVIVKGNFDCSGNRLTSLSGAPKEVHGNFLCDYNRLTSLSGVSQKIKGNFDCSHNLLTSLSGAPKQVGGGFNCGYNQLTSLSGAPQKVKGDFDCSHNLLTSLSDGPKQVGGRFWCDFNHLTSLFGAPEKCCGGFSFSHNRVTSLQYLPIISEPGYNDWYCALNPLRVDNNVSDFVLDNIHALIGIHEDMVDELVFKRGERKLRLAREKQRRHILHRNASRQR